MVAEPFARISYTDAVDTLLQAIAAGRKFEFPVAWGEDLKSEHERYLAEEVFKKARAAKSMHGAPGLAIGILACADAPASRASARSR